MSTLALAPLLASTLLAQAAPPPPRRILVGVDEGAGSRITLIDYGSDDRPLSFEAYPGFLGGVTVALGDVDSDGFPDIITAAGPGSAGGHVKVFDGVTGAERRSFFAFANTFTGGVHVAAGDVTGDGTDDIIVGAGAGAAGGHVKVFDGATLDGVHDFFAFEQGFMGGVRVATGDVDSDGRSDIIVATGSGTPALVRVFDGATGGSLRDISPYAATFTGGVFVSAGDVDGDGRSDIITGTGSGAGPHVKVFNGLTGTMTQELFPYTPGFQGGVRVSAGDVTGDATVDLLIAAGPGAALPVAVHVGPTLAPTRSVTPFSAQYSSGTWVAAAKVIDVLLRDGFE